MSENKQSFHVEHSGSDRVPRGTKMREISMCPLCASTTISPYLTAHDHTVSKETFAIVKCDNCQFCFTNPQPEEEDLPLYYQSEDYVSHSETTKGTINKLYHYAQKINLNSKFRLCNRVSKKGHWADYGSGAGAFAQYAQHRGKTITGFEPDSGARLASKRKGINALPVDHFPNDTSYACITLWHVVEHIPDFISKLELLSEALIPGGVLVLAMPNHLSHDAILYKSHWAAYDLPRHLWHFTAKDVQRIASRLNLKLESTSPMYLDSFYVSMLSEEYKEGSKLKGILNGLISDILAAIKHRPYSSQIYVLRK